MSFIQYPPVNTEQNRNSIFAGGANWANIFFVQQDRDKIWNLYLPLPSSASKKTTKKYVICSSKGETKELIL